MRELLKEIGKKKNARDLSGAEAAEAARLIVSAEASDVQVAAFLMAMRIKGESAEEFLAMTRALRGACQQVRPTRPVALELGGPFDGREASFAAGIAVGLILASLGHGVALTGSDTLPPKYGVTTRDILTAMGLASRPLAVVGQVARIAEASLDDLGIAYLHLDALCPPLARLRPIREQIGLRTMLNTVEKLIDPTGAAFAVSGVYHGNVMEPVAELQLRLGYRKGLVVQGIEGSAEVHLSRRTNLCLSEASGMVRETVEPEALGFALPPSEPSSLSATDQATRTLAVLEGTPGPDRDRVLLTAALYLRVLTGDAMAGTLAMAREALDGGGALACWRAWRDRGMAGLSVETSRRHP